MEMRFRLTHGGSIINLRGGSWNGDGGSGADRLRGIFERKNFGKERGGGRNPSEINHKEAIFGGETPVIGHYCCFFYRKQEIL